MTMHLVGPYLTTTGKKRGIHKFRSAVAAQNSRNLEASWKELNKKWGVTQDDKKRRRALSSLPYIPTPNPRLAELYEHKSLEATWETCAKAPVPVYSGSKILGISVLHKSNAVPVFSTEEINDIARMRR